METETLRRYERMAREVGAESAELNKLVDELQQQSPEQRAKALNATYQDKLFADLLDQKQQTEQRLADIQRDLGEQHPDARRAAATLEKVNAQLKDRDDAIMTGLQAKANSLKAREEAIAGEIEQVKKADIASAQEGRPYFEAKRELEKQKQTRDLLRQQIAGLNSQVATPVSEPSDPPPAPKPAGPTPVPQPEVLARDNAFSTFSLNVSDVSFKLAAASLEQGQMPDPASVRSEEFINAFDYRDPEAPPGAPLAFAWERARAPFAHNRDLLRFSVKTAASGRQADRPLHLTLVLDNSGSMERADRVRIVHEGLRALAGLLQPADKLSVITFARTARLRVDGAPGSQAAAVMKQVGGLTPEGGTNLEEALRLAYATAARHYLAGGINHVVLLTDGAANLGDVDPASLQRTVEAHRRQGIALDCFGVGWEGFNDDLLEVLARRGDGRYGFLNSPAEAASGFAAQLAGALRVAASDVKVQVEFNPRRVNAWRQIGYAKHQLTKEQFRDNTVDAAELAAQEAGNALYAVEVNPRGEGPLATVRARFKVPGTTEYREHAWEVPFTGNAVSVEQASPAMRLAATASAFSEWLASSPFAGEVTPDRLLELLRGVPETFGADVRARKLEEMIRQAKNLRGQE
jgi:Mg-chelatase subunit ChlD